MMPHPTRDLTLRLATGGTTAHPNDNTACPSRSAAQPIKLVGTLCMHETGPYIFAPALIVNEDFHMTYRQPSGWTPTPGARAG